MKAYVKDNKIAAAAKFCEQCFYDIGNRVLTFRTDGKGNLTKLSRSGYGDVIRENSFYLNVTASGSTVCETSAEKTVEMFGKRQTVDFEVGGRAARLTVFTDDYSPCAFISVECAGAEIEVNFGYDALGATLSTSGTLLLRERIDDFYHYTCQGRDRILLAIGFEALGEGLESAYLRAEENACRYEAFLNESAKIANEGGAEYASALNCALSMYKEIDTACGGVFRGFFAGINYMSPPRTYYRDGYFTALPTLKFFPEMTRNQILTLSLGIGTRGVCGSAVTSGGEPWWENHIDSPLYYVLLTDAYLKETGDKSILKEVVREKTVEQNIALICDEYVSRLDENGLLYRESGNRLDWCDNVYREGYVTYIEALCAAALASAERILNCGKYGEAAARVKAGTERELFDAARGCFVNYKSKNVTEDNLSIDTALLALFDVTDREKGEKMLSVFESVLESRNNKNAPFGDYGTMCVYPPYKTKAHLVEKSSYDFVYHNGAEWVFWSAVYAIARRRYKMDCTYPLTRWFELSLINGWFTPIEYYSKICSGSSLQGWSGLAALAFDESEINKLF